MEYGPTEECDFFQDELENVLPIGNQTVPVNALLIENQNVPVNALLNDNQNVPVNALPNEINYYSEVKCIMYAFGDVKKPLKSSVKYMHGILQNQMTLLIKNAEDVMELRNGKNISHQDVLFLMRKNKVLLKRLLHFLFVEDAKSRFLPNIKKHGSDFKPENGQRVSQCLKYFSFIEKFSEDLTSVLRDESIVDHVYMNRLKRRYLMAESMTNEEYKHFSEFTLRMTFCHKYAYKRFKNWLQQCSCTTTDITPLALSIIHFLARETIAGIVDKALEIKSKKYEKSDNFQFEDCSDQVDQFCKSEQDLVNSRTNLQSSSSKISENSSDNKTYDVEDSSTNSKLENKIAENHTIILNTFKDMHKIDVDPVSYNLDNNSSSKSAKNKFDISHSKRKISKSFSISNKNSNAKKSKKDHDMCDNFKLDNKLPSTNYANDAIMRIDQVIEDVVCRYRDTSEETYLGMFPHFSLNFKEKNFSICYNGSETFEINTSSALQAGRFNKTTVKEDKNLARSCIVEDIDESDLDCVKTKYSSLLNGYSKHIGHFPFTAPIKVDSQVHWFPNEAITPAEIQAAFISYQLPLPMSCFMKSRLFGLPPRKTNLVCLGRPDEFV